MKKIKLILLGSDGKTITLYLRIDANWSDGTRITAQQAKQSIESTLSDNVKSDAQPLLIPIMQRRYYPSIPFRRNFLTIPKNQSGLQKKYIEMNQITNTTEREIALNGLESFLIENHYVKALYKADISPLVHQNQIPNYKESKSCMGFYSLESALKTLDSSNKEI